MSEAVKATIPIPGTDWVCMVWASPAGGCTFKRTERGGHIIITGTYLNAWLTPADDYLWEKLADLAKAMRAAGGYDPRKAGKKAMPFRK